MYKNPGMNISLEIGGEKEVLIGAQIAASQHQTDSQRKKN